MVVATAAAVATAAVAMVEALAAMAEVLAAMAEVLAAMAEVLAAMATAALLGPTMADPTADPTMADPTVVIVTVRTKMKRLLGARTLALRLALPNLDHLAAIKALPNLDHPAAWVLRSLGHLAAKMRRPLGAGTLLRNPANPDHPAALKTKRTKTSDKRWRGWRMPPP
jgi:hypothetical protein